MRYAALVRPAIDRVYVTMRATARPRTREIIEETGLDPGYIGSFYWGLLAKPMPADGFAAATTYSGGDMEDQVKQGLAFVDEAGSVHLTDNGHDLALRLQEAIADSAEEQWAQTPAGGTMPWPDRLERLSDLLGRLLEAGVDTGGPAFHAMSPPHEPEGASLALKVTSRLGALRHHRGDAHRAAWKGAGLTLAQLHALPADDPQRLAIEDETNRLDAPIYLALIERERWEFLALLASL